MRSSARVCVAYMCMYAHSYQDRIVCMWLFLTDDGRSAEDAASKVLAGEYAILTRETDPKHQICTELIGIH